MPSSSTTPSRPPAPAVRDATAATPVDAANQPAVEGPLLASTEDETPRRSAAPIAPGGDAAAPYFEVSLDDPNLANTTLTVTNTSASAALTKVTLWTDMASPPTASTSTSRV
jgi:hypothetical protein